MRGRAGGHRDEGMVTAELAVSLPALVLALLAALTAIEVTTAQLRCRDAAGVAARMAARQDSTVTVRSAALGDAPGHAALSISRRGALVRVVVTDRVRSLWRLGPSLTVRASATAAIEPGSGATGQ